MVPGLFNYLFEQYDPASGKPWEALSQPEYPFSLKVLVPKKLNPRDVCFQEHYEAARVFCSKVMQGRSIFSHKEMVVLPERWLSPVEQFDFLEILSRHPNASTLKELRIVTQSLAILSTVDPQSVHTYVGEAEETVYYEPQVARVKQSLKMYSSATPLWQQPFEVA